MRLWHYKLIKYLPDKQLLGQHRECCALRGNGWGKKHSVVNYAFDNNYLKLTFYHKQVMKEMHNRGFDGVNTNWYFDCYRGKAIGFSHFEDLPNINYAIENFTYYEHNDKYLKECLENLKSKGVSINFKESQI